MARTDPARQRRELDVNREAAGIVAEWMRTAAYMEALREGWAVAARTWLHGYACRRIYRGMSAYVTITCKADFERLRNEPEQQAEMGW